jgi:MFS transporter, putative metabolite:H+ symporter
MSSSARSGATFGLCLLGITLSTADQALFSFAIPGMLREYGIGLDAMGVLLSVSFACASVAVVGAGVLSDRIGRVRVFAVLLAASALCVGLHALAGSFTTVAILRVLSFALAAGLYPIANAIVLETAPARYRGMMAGLLQLGYPLGFFVASLFASPLVDTYGWRSIFLPAFLVIPAALWIGMRMREPSRFLDVASLPTGGTGAGAAAHFAVLWSARWRGRSFACLAGSALLSVSIGAFTFFMPTFLTEARGLTDAAAARLAGLTYLIGAVGYLVSAYVGEFVLTRRNTLVLWVMLGAAIYASAILFAQTELALMLGLGVAVMFMFGSEAVRMPMVGEMFPTELRVTASAATGSVGVTLGWLAAPLAVGLMVPALGWVMTFCIVGAVPLALSGLVFLLLENRASGRPLEDRVTLSGHG